MVELISKTVGKGPYENLNDEEIIAAIARHSTIKDDNGRLVKYLMDNKHWSPLMHISYGFKIQTRRSISAQIFRHYSLSAQEWSLRYSEPIGFETIELRREHPTNRQSSVETFSPILPGGKDANSAIGDLLTNTMNLYSQLIDAGVAKECARDILPLCTKTIVHITGSLRNLLSFLNVRMDHHAQKEIREIAYEIGLCLEEELPNVMGRINWREGMFL